MTPRIHPSHPFADVARDQALRLLAAASRRDPEFLGAEIATVLAETASGCEEDTYARVMHLIRALVAVGEGHVTTLVDRCGMSVSDALHVIDRGFDAERESFRQ